MDNKKPARVVICRGCTQEFERSQANQRYCPTCRQARADALEALRVKVCNHCGAERDDCKHGICPDCREIARVRRNADEEATRARKLARFNAKGGCPCGKPSTSPYSGLCDDCDSKRHNERRRAFREQWRQEAQEKRQETAPQDWKDSFMDWYDSLPNEQQVGVSGALKSFVLSMISTAVLPVQTNPEEEAHADQDDIDAAFRDLLGGLDL